MNVTFVYYQPYPSYDALTSLGLNLQIQKRSPGFILASTAVDVLTFMKPCSNGSNNLFNVLTKTSKGDQLQIVDQHITTARAFISTLSVGHRCWNDRNRAMASQSENRCKTFSLIAVDISHHNDINASLHERVCGTFLVTKRCGLSYVTWWTSILKRLTSISENTNLYGK